MHSPAQQVQDILSASSRLRYLPPFIYTKGIFTEIYKKNG